MTASAPPTLWLVMQAFAPFSRLRMPTWHSTLFGSVRSSHIGLTVVGEIAAEHAQVAVRLAHQRKIVVLVLERAGARSDVDAGSIGEPARLVGRKRFAIRGVTCGDAAGYAAYRGTLAADASNLFADRTGIYVGSGAGGVREPVRFFPADDRTKGDLQAFGRELADTVNPMWLLRTLPNNVLATSASAPAEGRQRLHHQP